MEPIASPCIRKCCLNECDVCLGCFRALSEIVTWTQTDNENRQIYLENARIRRELHLKHLGQYKRSL